MDDRLGFAAVRETLFLGLSGLGAFIALNHSVIFLENGATWFDAAPAAYPLLTILIYTWIRGLAILATFRSPRARGSLELCAECGQPYPDGTPLGRETHAALPGTPRPTEREILAAVALRRAIDQARVARDANRIPADAARALRGIEDLRALERRRPDGQEPIVVRRTLREPPRTPPGSG